MHEYIIQHFINVGPSGRGHWYECRRIKANSIGEAVSIAFPGGIPYGYRVVTV